MGKAVSVNGGIGNSVWGNKWDTTNDLDNSESLSTQILANISTLQTDVATLQSGLAGIPQHHPKSQTTQSFNSAVTSTRLDYANTNQSLNAATIILHQLYLRQLYHPKPQLL